MTILHVVDDTVEIVIIALYQQVKTVFKTKQKNEYSWNEYRNYFSWFSRENNSSRKTYRDTFSQLLVSNVNDYNNF